MARSLDQPVTFKQIYFVLPSDIAERFKVKCAQDRFHQKQKLLQLVTDYVEEKPIGKAKVNVTK